MDLFSIVVIIYCLMNLTKLRTNEEHIFFFSYKIPDSIYENLFIRYTKKNISISALYFGDEGFGELRANATQPWAVVFPAEPTILDSHYSSTIRLHRIHVKRDHLQVTPRAHSSH